MEEDECPECEVMAGWIMTFADLMSLLMCFFVLLLSFSEMDVQKYKQVAGSMAFAFGVQREIKADEIPKGTSIIAQEFSPGKPQPTPIPEVRQVTTDEFKKNLDFSDSEEKNNKSQKSVEEENKTVSSIEKLQEQLEQQAEAKAEEVKKALKKEIAEGLIEITTKDDQVVIRIREKGSFTSGSADLQKEFYPVMRRVSRALSSIRGRILVAGHTDNIPIRTIKFPSNWVLSAARAANVVHFMTSRGGISPRRVEIRAHADMQPLNSNKSRKSRAKNRRVEIIVKGDEKTLSQIKKRVKKKLRDKI